MRRTQVDLVVVGLGVMGAATLREAAGRGKRVVGIEQFAPGHTRGSSHGRSRAHSLFYADDYLELALRAREGWLSIQQRAGGTLFYPCGMLVWDSPGASEFEATLAAFAAKGVNHSVLSPAEVTRRFPILALPPGSTACLMPDAGFLDADVCVASLVEQARADGALTHYGQRVTRIDLDGALPRVITESSTYACERLVVTPGPWAGQLLADCGWPFVVTLQNVFNFLPSDPGAYGPDVLPVLGDRITGEYSFPMHVPGIKVAQSAFGPAADPEAVRPEPPAQESMDLGRWLHTVLPGLSARPLGGVACLYTVTPDRGFILSRHPSHAAVVVGAGFSGRGFKFAPAIGRLLADMALRDAPAPAFLSPDRFFTPSASLWASGK
jgi:sarcosine oxidase